jgi:hypothetical protein
MDESHRMLVAAAAICIHQLLLSFVIIFDDVPTAYEARAAKRRKRELTPYKRNLSMEYGTPTTNLEHVPHLECILQDINRPYMKDVTHLHGWQFFLLTNYCQLWITLVVTFLLAYVWERMIVKCLLVVLYIYGKANSSQKMSS